jgi:phospholipase/carboxylesterase
MTSDPHRDQPVLRWGAPMDKANGAILLLHGRGSSAEDIAPLGEAIGAPGLAYLAAQAAGNTWYPHSFLAPLEQNEPYLSSALRKVESLVDSLNESGVASDRIVICGFSQGACLSTEFVARHPRRYASLIALTGGLIGPLDADMTHEGDLAGTPAFFGSGDPDLHVPWQRVQQSADVMKQMGAAVTARRYPGRPHTVLPEEIQIARQMVQRAFAAGSE